MVRVARRVFIVAGVLGILGITAAGTFHLRLVKSEPAADAVVDAPERIDLWYSEEPALALTRVRVTGPDGKAVTLEPAVVEGDGKHLAAPVADLVAGAWTLDWRTQSKDGHVVSGSFGFTVKAQD